MIDQQAIHADMQRIFSAGASAPVERGTGRPATRALAIVPSARKRFMGRKGIVAAGFALAVTAIGLFAAPLLKTPPSSPAPVAAISPAIPTVTTPAVAPAPISAPAPVMAVPIASAPVVAAAPSPVVVAPPATVQRRARAHHTRRAQVRRRPHARTALQRAWARDRVLTRRLNQQVLRRMQAR